jgi:hypothetical protein
MPLKGADRNPNRSIVMAGRKSSAFDIDAATKFFGIIGRYDFGKTPAIKLIKEVTGGAD